MAAAATAIRAGKQRSPRNWYSPEEERQGFDPARCCSSSGGSSGIGSSLFHSPAAGNKNRIANKKKDRPRENEGVIRATGGGGSYGEGGGSYGDAEYVRPRIRKDLLPHDFSEWKSTPNGSILPSAPCSASRSVTGRGSSAAGLDRRSSSNSNNSNNSRCSSSIGSCRSGNVGSGLSPRTPSSCRAKLCEGSESYLVSGVEQDNTGRPLLHRSSHLEGRRSFSSSRSSAEGEVRGSSSSALALLNAMEDWTSNAGILPNGAAAIDRTIYQNLVEMIPLMESFMEQKNKRGAFTRHASMVYTPAPSRDTPVRKVSESPLKSKKNKQQKPGTVQKQAESKDAEAPLWDEQENILRRVERDDCATQYNEPAVEKLNREELVQLQNQIDALKQQVWEKDNMLQSVRSFDAAERARQEEIAELKTKVEDLQKNLWDKERAAQTMQCQLAQKQKELVNMESLLERIQCEVMKKNEAARSLREELSQLQVQVSAFQFQAELQNVQLDDPHADATAKENDDDAEDLGEPMFYAEFERDSSTMEAARRMYLGAVVAAKVKPGAESIALAAVLRKQLEAFLMHPYLSGGPPQVVFV